MCLGFFLLNINFTLYFRRVEKFHIVIKMVISVDFSQNKVWQVVILFNGLILNLLKKYIPIIARLQ